MWICIHWKNYGPFYVSQWVLIYNWCIDAVSRSDWKMLRGGQHLSRRVLPNCMRCRVFWRLTYKTHPSWQPPKSIPYSRVTWMSSSTTPNFVITNHFWHPEIYQLAWYIAFGILKSINRKPPSVPWLLADVLTSHMSVHLATKVKFLLSLGLPHYLFVVLKHAILHLIRTYMFISWCNSIKICCMVCVLFDLNFLKWCVSNSFVLYLQPSPASIFFGYKVPRLLVTARLLLVKPRFLLLTTIIPWSFVKLSLAGRTAFLLGRMPMLIGESPCSILFP